MSEIKTNFSESELNLPQQPGEIKKKFTIKHLRWYIVGLLFMATTINYLDRQTLSIAAPILRDQFGMSNTDYSRIVQAFLIAYCIMQSFSGRIIDWLGTKRGFALAVIWWASASICHFFARGVGSFAFFRFLLGMGEAGNFPAAIKTVSEWFPAKERAFATGLFNMGAGLGAIIAPPLIGFMILEFDWRLAFIFTGAVDFCWVVIWLIFYHSPERHPMISPQELEYIQAGQVKEESKFKKGVIQELLKSPSQWGLMTARFVSDPVWWFYIFWLPDYLKNARGFGIAEIAMFAWLPFLTADFGSIIGGSLSSYFIKRGFSTIKARKLAMCISASVMPVALFAVRSESVVFALACICIATLGHQSWAANLLTLPADLFPKRCVATAYGMTGSVGTVGGFVFAGLVGFLLDSVGYLPVFSMVGVMHPIAAIIIVLLVKSKIESAQVKEV